MQTCLLGLGHRFLMAGKPEGSGLSMPQLNNIPLIYYKGQLQIDFVLIHLAVQHQH